MQLLCIVLAVHCGCARHIRARPTSLRCLLTSPCAGLCGNHLLYRRACCRLCAERFADRNLNRSWYHVNAMTMQEQEVVPRAHACES